MSSSASSAAAKPYTLFNKPILDGNVAQEIKFNPVAQTALVKALTRVSVAESATAKLKVLSKESIKQLVRTLYLEETMFCFRADAFLCFRKLKIDTILGIVIIWLPLPTYRQILLL